MTISFIKALSIPSVNVKGDHLTVAGS